MLQPVEHVPAVKSGHVEIERDRVGAMLPRHLQANVAAHRAEHAEFVLAAQVHQDARIGVIVFDDQQHPIPGLDPLAIVVERVVVDRQLLLRERAIDRERVSTEMSATRSAALSVET